MIWPSYGAHRTFAFSTRSQVQRSEGDDALDDEEIELGDVDESEQSECGSVASTPVLSSDYERLSRNLSQARTGASFETSPVSIQTSVADAVNQCVYPPPPTIGWFNKYCLAPIYFSVQGGLSGKMSDAKGVSSMLVSHNPAFALGNVSGAIFFPFASAVDMILTQGGDMATQAARERAETELLDAMHGVVDFGAALEAFRKAKAEDNEAGKTAALQSMGRLFMQQFQAEKAKLSHERFTVLQYEQILGCLRDAGLVGWYTNTAAVFRLIPALTKLYGNVLVPGGMIAAGVLYFLAGVSQMYSAQNFLRQSQQGIQQIGIAQERVNIALAKIQDPCDKDGLVQFYDGLCRLCAGRQKAASHDQKVKTGHGALVGATGAASTVLTILGLANPVTALPMGIATLGVWMGYFAYVSGKLALQSRQQKHDAKQDAAWISEASRYEIGEMTEKDAKLARTNPYIAVRLLLSELGHQDEARRQIATDFLANMGVSPQQAQAFAVAAQNASSKENASKENITAIMNHLLWAMTEGLHASLASTKALGQKDPAADHLIQQWSKTWLEKRTLELAREGQSGNQQLLLSDTAKKGDHDKTLDALLTAGEPNESVRKTWCKIAQPKISIGTILKFPGWMLDSLGREIPKALGGNALLHYQGRGAWLMHGLGHIWNLPWWLLGQAGRFLQIPGELLNRSRWLSRQPSVRDEIALNHQIATALRTRTGDLMPYTPKFLLNKLTSSKKDEREFAEMTLRRYLQQQKKNSDIEQYLTVGAQGNVNSGDWHDVHSKKGPSLLRVRNEITEFLESEATRLELTNSRDAHRAVQLLYGTDPGKKNGALLFAQEALGDLWKEEYEQLDNEKNKELENNLVRKCVNQALDDDPRSSQIVDMLQSKSEHVADATKEYCVNLKIDDALIDEIQKDSGARQNRHYFAQRLSVERGHRTQVDALPAVDLIKTWVEQRENNADARAHLKVIRFPQHLTVNVFTWYGRQRRQHALQSNVSGDKIVARLLGNQGRAEEGQEILKRVVPENQHQDIEPFAQMVKRHWWKLNQIHTIPSFSWFGAKGHATTATFFGSQQDRRRLNEYVEVEFIGNRRNYAHTHTPDFIFKLIQSKDDFSKEYARKVLQQAYQDVDGKFKLDAQNNAKNVVEGINEEDSRKELSRLLVTHQKLLKYESRMNTRRIVDVISGSGKRWFQRTDTNVKLIAAERVLKMRGASDDLLNCVKGTALTRAAKIQQVNSLLRLTH